MVAAIEDSVEKIELLNTPNKYTSISFSLPVDSGSTCSFLDKSLAMQSVESNT